MRFDYFVLGERRKSILFLSLGTEIRRGWGTSDLAKAKTSYVDSFEEIASSALHETPEVHQVCFESPNSKSPRTVILN